MATAVGIVEMASHFKDVDGAAAVEYGRTCMCLVSSCTGAESTDRYRQASMTLDWSTKPPRHNPRGPLRLQQNPTHSWNRTLAKVGDDWRQHTFKCAPSLTVPCMTLKSQLLEHNAFFFAEDRALRRKNTRRRIYLYLLSLHACAHSQVPRRLIWRKHVSYIHHVQQLQHEQQEMTGSFISSLSKRPRSDVCRNVWSSEAVVPVHVRSSITWCCWSRLSLLCHAALFQQSCREYSPAPDTRRLFAWHA